MATIRRASGITIQTSGPLLVESERPHADPSGPILTPPRPGRRRGRAPRRGRPAEAPRTQAIPNEGDVVAQALVDRQLTLLDAVPLRTAPGGAGPRRPGRRRGRRAGEALAPAPAQVALADLAVPLSPSEQAIVLLEQDGVYSWHLPSAPVAAKGAPSSGAPKKKRKAGTDSSGARVVHFRLEVVRAPQPVAPPGRRKLGIVRKVIGKAVAYVFTVAARPVVKRVAAWLERDVAEGLVRITGTDPAGWVRDASQAVPVPARSPARILLLVHGTFSSTLGSFGSLGASREGKAFLTAALQEYDLVIGWDHRTLSVTPLDNARALLQWFEGQRWPAPPVIDAIAFSRGGLVLRSLVESLLPASPFRGRLRRAVFVACTNGGTELARPANWQRLADTYLNMAAAGVRALAFVPGFTSGATILSEAIRGVGGLVKALANVVVVDEAVPGLAAMNPDGDFVRELNAVQPGQPAPNGVWYGAITSDFDPDRAAALGRSQEIPPGLFLRLADKGADALAGKPNDLVVHVEAMTQIDPGNAPWFREKLEYGTNGTVHHCRYFHEPDTADALSRWLG